MPVSPSSRGPRSATVAAAGLVVLSISFVFSAACGGGGGATIYCAKSDYGCRCAIDNFDLTNDEVAVDNCNDVLDTASGACCHDLDAAGDSTYCQCATHACYTLDGDCDCGVVTGPIPEGAESVAACVTGPDLDQCCSAPGYNCNCQSFSGTPFQCFSGGADVDACPAAPEYFEGYCGARIATSCRDIKWHQEPDPSGIVIIFPF